MCVSLLVGNDTSKVRQVCLAGDDSNVSKFCVIVNLTWHVISDLYFNHNTGHSFHAVSPTEFMCLLQLQNSYNYKTFSTYHCMIPMLANNVYIKCLRHYISDTREK